jgi:hypothetical protein
VGLTDLREFAAVSVEADAPGFTKPLQVSARTLGLDPRCEVVLLGSIATPKYVEALLPVFGERLLFPSEFVGRGDMSRGGLLLRCAAADEELHYIQIQGAIRKGRRPMKLTARTAALSRERPLE